MDQWLDFSDCLEKTRELIDLGLLTRPRTCSTSPRRSFLTNGNYYFLYSRIYTEQNKAQEALPYLHKALALTRRTSTASSACSMFIS